ncbi:hypothetical protein KAR50_05580 [Periweissella fabaria]|uniref:Bacterial Pleckstrin homology domain-containing protein n=1 Tax=Periweissella fabaria TaxID=546157 RepID=A0ABM8Z4D6_9LACO|nr:hypothetical protein [Periweissella fabaria]MCM0597312.1 hypothetical protein [Periweissella fabaria]CAH0416184.1 hypothetical protein WFA24289_00483 [Periweissella fabaria]
MENVVKIENQTLIVIPQGVNKLAALKDKLEFPLAQVVGASIDAGILHESKGLRAPGTALPGYWAGTFHKDGEKTFFNVKSSSQPVVIQLKNAEFARLVLGVDQPVELVRVINNHIN